MSVLHHANAVQFAGWFNPINLIPLAQMSQRGRSDGGEAIIGVIVLLIELALAVLIIAGMWRIFEKAGKPGWAAIIPIYNLIVLLEIIRKPIWWFIVMLIPCVGIVFAILVYIELAKAFNKGGGFAAGLFFLPFIFFPILGFGDAEYAYGRSSKKKLRQRDYDEEDDYDNQDDDYHERPRRHR